VGTRKPKRPTARLEPIFPVRNLATALVHYEGLGFKTSTFDENYGFAERDGVTLHLSARGEHGGNDNPSAAYLQVPDADVVAAAWSKAGVGGVTRPAQDTPWGRREGSHTDPDGNLIRFGAPTQP
jgi:predicted enzyme related to lactoylglutathione lyase